MGIQREEKKIEGAKEMEEDGEQCGENDKEGDKNLSLTGSFQKWPEQPELGPRAYPEPEPAFQSSLWVART